MLLTITRLRIKLFVNLYQQWVVMVGNVIHEPYKYQLRKFYENLRWCVPWSYSNVFGLYRELMLKDLVFWVTVIYSGQGNSFLNCWHKIRNHYFFLISCEETGLVCSFFSSSRNRTLIVCPILKPRKRVFYTCLVILKYKLVMMPNFSNWTNKEH